MEHVFAGARQAPEVNMRIGLIGGVERSEAAYRELADRHGHQLEFHSGHTGGRGSTRLTMIGRSVELLIVVTDVNSHGAVQLARKVARANGIPVVLHRRCSPARFGEILADFGAGQRAAS
jgi:hypothetical protein